MDAAIKNEKLIDEAKLEVYSLLAEGYRNLKENRIYDATEVFDELEKED